MVKKNTYSSAYVPRRTVIYIKNIKKTKYYLVEIEKKKISNRKEKHLLLGLYATADSLVNSS